MVIDGFDTPGVKLFLKTFTIFEIFKPAPHKFALNGLLRFSFRQFCFLHSVRKFKDWVISKTYYISPNGYTVSGSYVSVTSQL